MYKGFSYEDGRIVNVAYFNGYDFGDRMLEGVPFKAEVINGELRVSFAYPKGRYESGLNQDKWLKEALEYAQDNDTFFERATLDGECLYLELE